MSKENEQETLNETFEGWENSEEMDFFGDGPAKPTEASKVIEDVNKDDLKTDKTEKVKEEEEPKEEEKKEDKVEDIDLFGENDETDAGNKQQNTSKEDPEGGEEDEPEQVQEVSSKTTLNFLKDKGIVDFELEEGEELTEEKAEELLEDKYEESVEERVEELVQDMPDVLKQMIKYHKDGGDVGQLISTIKPKSTVSKDTDLSTEDNQILVIREQLTADGHDEEYISSNIEFLKDSGKLESTSKKFFDKIIAKNDQQVQAQTKAQEDLRKEKKQKQRAFKTEISSHLKENDEISQVKFTTKDKKDLPSYISDTTVKLENGQSISPLQRDLYKALQDKDKTLVLAKLLRDDFDFSNISKEATTKVAKEVKKELQHSQSLTPKKSGSTSQKKKKDLADFFN